MEQGKGTAWLLAGALLLAPCGLAQHDHGGSNNNGGYNGGDRGGQNNGGQDYGNRGGQNNYYGGMHDNIRGGGYDQRYQQDERDHHHDDRGGGIGPGYGALIGGGGGAALGAVFGGGLKGTLIGGAAGAGLGALGGKLAQGNNHHDDRYRH